jgi:hypothetical protein
MLRSKDARIAARYIPAGSAKHEQPGGVAYTYNPPLPRVGYGLIAYRGTAGKPDHHTTYRTEAQRDAELALFFARIKRHADYKATHKPERATFDPAAPVRADYSLTETTQVVRYLLGQAFPGVKFSVRSQSYSMGCCIHVDWADGPTEKQVNPLLNRFNHKGFDGMTDSTYYNPPLLWRGQKVTFHVDSVRGRRLYSAALLRDAAEHVSLKTGLPELRELSKSHTVAAEWPEYAAEATR